ncbi:ribosome-associated translation inhibitor RaiA [bacterium]|nr:ribosome-associated translation inhibitor RaiA [bacterium]
MDITITSRHTELPEDLKDLLAGKIENALKVFPRVVRGVRIIVEHDKYLYDVEAVADLTTQKTLTAAVRHKDLSKSIDVLADTLNEQIRRLKERIEAHHKRYKTPRAVKTKRTANTEA